jgi:hypothetical protein
MESKASATAMMRAPSEIWPSWRPCGYPLPSRRSWCSTTAAAHSPSHGARGAIRRAPSDGCVCMAFHWSASSRAGLFRISADTDSFPMSCIRADQRSRSLSSRSSPSSCASISVNTRTRSEWPLVRESCAVSAAISASMLPAGSPRPASRSCLTATTFALRRATTKRDGATLGKDRLSLRSMAIGASLRVARSAG